MVFGTSACRFGFRRQKVELRISLYAAHPPYSSPFFTALGSSRHCVIGHICIGFELPPPPQPQILEKAVSMTAGKFGLQPRKTYPKPRCQ